MLLSILAVTLIGCIGLRMPGVSALFTENGSLSEGQTFGVVMLTVMSAILYILILVGVTYGMLIYLGVHFYKSMYTDEGYLAHTLPVTPNQLLLSKILVGGCWYLLLTVTIFISMFVLLGTLFTGILMISNSDRSAWELLSEGAHKIVELYEQEMGLDILHYVITVGLAALIGPFTSMMTLFGSITLGQLSRKHKAMMGILAYVGVMIVTMIVSSIIQAVTSFSYSIEMMHNQGGSLTMNMNFSYDVNLLLNLVIGAVLYAVSYYILNKKLNLD